MAAHSHFLAWKVPQTEGPAGFYSPWCHKELDITKHEHIYV